MKKAVAVELMKADVGPGVGLKSVNMSHVGQILKSEKVGMKICGKNYTFELTHPDVAKGRGAINQVLGQK